MKGEATERCDYTKAKPSQYTFSQSIYSERVNIFKNSYLWLIIVFVFHKNWRKIKQQKYLQAFAWEMRGERSQGYIHKQLQILYPSMTTEHHVQVLPYLPARQGITGLWIHFYKTEVSDEEEEGLKLTQGDKSFMGSICSQVVQLWLSIVTLVRFVNIWLYQDK